MPTPTRWRPCTATSAASWSSTTARTGELYDLQEDPGEFHNLWSSGAHAALRHDLMARSFDATVMAQDWGSPRVAAH